MHHLHIHRNVFLDRVYICTRDANFGCGTSKAEIFCLFIVQQILSNLLTATRHSDYDRDSKLQSKEQLTGQVPSNNNISTDTTITPSAIISIFGTTVGSLTVFALSLLLYCSKVR